MKKIIKSFFYSNNKFCVIYFWATMFLSLTAWMVICRLVAKYNAKLDFSDTLILGMMAGVVALIGLYSYFDKKYPSRWDGDERRERKNEQPKDMG